MITPKLGGEPIPSAFCHVPKYEVFPELYISVCCIGMKPCVHNIGSYTGQLGWKLIINPSHNKIP